MAKIIPTTFDNRASSRNAERRFFQVVQSSLGEEWLVFHSVWNRNHEFKAVSESDFLLLSKRGLLSIEVKGGVVSTRNKQWFFSSLNSSTESKPKNESPMDQARGALFAIQNYVVDMHPEMKDAFLNVPSTYGCYFPDTDFIGFEGCSDWPREMVWDASRISENPERVVGRMVEYAQGVFDRLGRKRREFTSAEIDIIFRSVAPQFYGVPSHTNSRNSSQLELRRLFDDKLHALSSALDNERMVVNGVAGSGKTLLAIQLARNFRRDYPDLRIALVCFNRLLADFLKFELSDILIGDSLFVGTAHTLLKDKFKLSDETLFDVDALGRVDDLLSNTSTKPFFDVLIVDEGQDFHANPAMIGFLDRLLVKGFENGRCYWFQDLNQQVLRPKFNDEVNYLRNYSLFRLTDNVRNPKSVAQFAKIIGRDGVMVIKRLEDGAQVSEMFDSLEVHVRRNSLEKILSRLHQKGVPPEDVVLLRYDNSISDCLDGVFSLGGYAIDEATFGIRPGFVRKTTVRKFKGMESHVVILYDVHADGDLSPALMYVGATRSQQTLGLVCSSEAFDKISETLLNM